MSYEAMVHALLIVLYIGLGESGDSTVLHPSRALTILAQKMVVFHFESYYDAIHVIHAVFQLDLTVVVVLIDEVVYPMTLMEVVALVLSAHSMQPGVYPGHPVYLLSYAPISFSSSVSSVRSRSRARLRRDFTVPIGHPSTDAISLSVKSAP
jgi:hypothetical protein